MELVGWDLGGFMRNILALMWSVSGMTYIPISGRRTIVAQSCGS
jgi:hypothetical protein